jgi:hypothetical protein
VIKNENDKKPAQSEIDAEKAAAKDAMPRLLAQRDKLEREGGSFNRVERNHWTRIAIGTVVTIAVALYALTQSGDEKAGAPVFLWILTGGCAIATAAMAMVWDKAKASRTREHNELSEKMRQVGRRIDSADRTMRR